MSPNALRLPTGLRDSPLALALAVLGILAVILGLGYLTARVGARWAEAYVRRQAQSGNW